MTYPQDGARSHLRLVHVRQRVRMDRARAAQLRQAVLALDPPSEAVAELVAVIDRNTVSEKGWQFTMLSMEQFAAVMAYLGEESPRPFKAAQVWTQMVGTIRHDSGEVTVSRADIAEAVGVTEAYVSRVASVLERCNAIRRERDGRGVRYFVNENVGTHLTGAARDGAQRAAGDLFSVVQGGAHAL